MSILGCGYFARIVYENLTVRLASVGLAQARPNYTLSNTGIQMCQCMYCENKTYKLDAGLDAELLKLLLKTIMHYRMLLKSNW